MYEKQHEFDSSTVLVVGLIGSHVMLSTVVAMIKLGSTGVLVVAVCW